jgi:VanZ family protein
MARIIRILLAAHVAVVALIVFWPTPVDRPVTGQIRTAVRAVQHAGATSISYSTVEIAANVAMFVPLGVLVVLAEPRRPWWWAPVAAGVFACVIEAVQFVFVAERFATWVDVAANTTGAVIGALGVHLFSAWRARRPRQRSVPELP